MATLLRLGARKVRVGPAEDYLRAYGKKGCAEWGPAYMDFPMSTDPRFVYPQDYTPVLFTLGRRPKQTLRTLVKETPFTISHIPNVPLHKTSAAVRDAIAQTIDQMDGWSYFGRSKATKLLHKKRPATVPVMDNEAIGEGYLATQKLSTRESLEVFFRDVHDQETAWRNLEALEPNRTRIEILDMIWWVHYWDGCQSLVSQ